MPNTARRPRRSVCPCRAERISCTPRRCPNRRSPSGRTSSSEAAATWRVDPGPWRHQRDRDDGDSAGAGIRRDGVRDGGHGREMRRVRSARRGAGVQLPRHGFCGRRAGRDRRTRRRRDPRHHRRGISAAQSRRAGSGRPAGTHRSARWIQSTDQPDAGSAAPAHHHGFNASGAAGAGERGDCPGGASTCGRSSSRAPCTCPCMPRSRSSTRAMRTG